ncbi:hypothetical protein BGX27_004110 [Mortierella sp. AM989]|nr:hypothetical protein BGX27_004110 [Mortierella sp. AM989]
MDNPQVKGNENNKNGAKSSKRKAEVPHNSTKRKKTVPLQSEDNKVISLLQLNPTERDIAIRRLLERYHSSDIPKNVLEEAIDCTALGKSSRHEVIGRMCHKFLVVLDLFLDSGNSTEKAMTKNSESVLSQIDMSTRAYERKLDDFIHKLWPSVTIEAMPKAVIKLCRILIGAQSITRDYCKAAMVSNAVLGPLRSDFRSWESLRRRFHITRREVGSKKKSARITDLGDLRLVQAAIGYSFRNERLLEDALCQLPKDASLQGRSCQRLEYLGDALLDIFVIEHWADTFPEIGGPKLLQLHGASTNRSVFSAASVNLCLEYHMHYNDPIKKIQVNKMVEDLVVAKWQEKLSDSRAPYWPAVEIRNKIFCNVYESLIGAVFADSDLDLDVTRQVFQRTLRPILVEYLEPQFRERN